MDKIVRVKSKEELIRELKRYKTILNSDKLDYINSIIELEFSALQNYITDEEKNILLNFPIYKEAVIYNVYNRAYSLFSKYDKVSKIGNESNNQNLNAFINGFKIFEFNYNSKSIYHDNKVGSILLRNQLRDENVIDKEIERIINKLDRLKGEVNPFSSSNLLQAYNWDFTHSNAIKECENLLAQYNTLYQLSDKEKNDMQLINEINEKLLEDYNIEFSKNDEIVDMTRSKMNKEYIKKLPDFQVKKIEKYV